jgi:hypothetical protein
MRLRCLLDDLRVDRCDDDEMLGVGLPGKRAVLEKPGPCPSGEAERETQKDPKAMAG